MSAPFTKEQLFGELRVILFTQASQVALVRNPKVAMQFLGIDVGDWNNQPRADDLAKIDLQQFDITRVLDIAYDFAFQTGAYWRFGDDHGFELAAFGAGITPHSFEGSQSPYLSDDSKVRHVVDMADARESLRHEWDITIRGLALLAGITEPAVRNSLSKDGIQTTGKPAKISADVALSWLGERRGFVPTLVAETQAKNRAGYVKLQLAHCPFPQALAQIVDSLEGLTIEQVADASGFDLDLLRDMVDGRRGCLDLGSLQQLAEKLDVDVPHFVGVAIEYGLRTS
ncbi:helix-turn-helix transcriptional regulator [Mesorhizobium sp. WSM3882]|uniref:helix-turn-helix transcriptional regulator n=1 Tax=Mesorhizobium sp. WSM3882 TaxID=2029407 RepID=UPI000BAFBC04|nr:helix-turn-helix transcriptional regulator [Mesorhizobium sp. WSM3882]PBB29206.1 hypothetical protein CK214_26390 [Mesorhizobium sp. WSM3882]